MITLLLLGADGQVGWELQRALSPLGKVLAFDRQGVDLTEDPTHVIDTHRPDVIVNSAAYTAVDKAESEPALAQRINAAAPGQMAAAAARHRALLVHYSTDYVFDGSGTVPWKETDPTGPLNVYGQSKLDGEVAIRATSSCAHLIFRTSWVYALRGRNFARAILQRALSQDHLNVVADTHGAPTSAELIADVTALAVRQRLAQRTATGSWPLAPESDRLAHTYHLVPRGVTTWHGYASHLLALAREAGIPVTVPADRILPVPASAFPTPALRPLNSRLSVEHLEQAFGLQMPDWQVHVARLVDALAREAAFAAPVKAAA